MNKRKRILLTGASGTVGYQVLKQLHSIKTDFDITVFDLKTPSARRKFKPFIKDVNVVWGNIYYENDLIDVSFDQDIIIHLAALIPPIADEKPELAFRVNTVGTKNLIRLLEQNSPNAFFIYSSSIAVYGDRLQNPWINIGDKLEPSPGDEYAKTKIAAEDIIHNCNLDWTIFRLAAIMGGHKMTKLMFHQPLSTSLEIATPEDTALAFVNAIDKKNQLSKKTFNLGGGENCRLPYDEFLSRSFKIFGLGKPDFPPKTFAEKNFHCGFYEDGSDLNDILNFQNDDMVSYFQKEAQKLSPFKMRLLSIFRKPIKKYLKKQSEPLQAFNNHDKEQMKHYFSE